MAEETKTTGETRGGIRLVRLPKLTRAQIRRIKAVRDWEKRSELRLMGFRARN